MRFLVRAIVAGAFVLGLMAAGPAAAQPTKPAEVEATPPPACTTIDIPGVGISTTCTCDIGPGDFGAVWGTGIFTNDSDICTAAVHAGALAPTGTEAMTRWTGAIEVGGAAGCDRYFGTPANGVTSSGYGAWTASIYFPAVNTGSCLVVPPGAPEGVIACPSDGLGVTAPLTCFCETARTSIGSVWGTGIFTGDSAICVAAVHAGFITSAGGTIVVNPATPPMSFVGSTANGVTSLSYGAYSVAYTLKAYVPPAP